MSASARWRRAQRDGEWGVVPLPSCPCSSAPRACGKDHGETGVKVIITPAPPTPTSVARSLTPPPTLAPSTAVTFPLNAPTITNATGSQLMAGVKAKVKDSADGLVLRESPSTKAKSVESLAGGTVLSVLQDPQEAEGGNVGEGLPRRQPGFRRGRIIDRAK